MRTVPVTLVLAVAAVACRGPKPATAAASTPQDCPAASASAAASTSATGDATSAPAPASPAASAAPGSATDFATPPAASGEPLPEVRVKNVGLHVGGGPNDAATKEPLQAAIAPHFADFRRCYAQVSSPGKAGVFGVDLRIPREGGHPTVQAARTSMGGDAFRDCVVGVFSSVEFARPPKGPTVISYSLEFTVGSE